jgi:lysozyme
MDKKKLIGGAVGLLAMAMALIAGFEGKSNTAYPDPINVPTICYGHTANVKPTDKKTDEECARLLHEDVKHAQRIVRKYVKVPLTENQEIALIDFVYNVGEGNFAKSTLLRLLNKGDYQGAAKQFTRWIYSGGKILPGLVARRMAEKNLFLKEDEQYVYED